MLGIAASLQKGGASLLTYVKDNLKLYLDFKSNKSDTLKFPSEGSTSFDGSDDYIQLPVPFSHTNHSISVWANHSGTNDVIFSAQDSSSDGIRLFIDDGNRLLYTINNSSALVATAYANQWVHYVCTYDGITMRVYANGVEVKNVATEKTVSTTTNARIGATSFENSNYFTGKLANVGFWSRCLESEEVQSIMNKSYSQLKGVEKTSLVSWWGLDNSSDRGADFWDVGVFTQEGSPTTSTYSNGLLNVVGNGNNTGAKFSFPSTGSTSIEGYNQYEFSFDIKITSGAGSVVKIQYHYSGAISSTFNDQLDTTEAPNQEFKRFVTTLYADNTYSSNRYFVFVQSGSTVCEFQVKNIVLKPITANDSKGSNHGQLVQEATTTTSVYGGNAPILPRAVDVAKEGQADAIGNGSASFDGDADHIELGSITSSNPLSLSGSAGSISAWIYLPDVSDGDNYKRIIDKSDGGNGASGYTIFIHADGTIGTAIQSANPISSDAGEITDAEWFHIAWTWDGSTHKLYKNGILIKSASSALTPSSDTANMSIGSWNHAVAREWKGNISQVGIWQGALTQAKIQSVMESTSYSKIPADVKSTTTEKLPSPDLTSGTGLTISQGTTGTLTHDTTAGTITGTDDVQDAYLRWYSAGLEENKLYKLEIVVDSYTDGRFRKTLGWNGTNFYPTVGTNIQYFIGSSTSAFGIQFDAGNPAEFVISKISVQEVTNDLVAYYPLDAIQPSDFSYAKYIPEARAGALGEELFTGWENNPLQSGVHYKGWSSFTTSGQTVTASQADEGAVYSKVFNTNAFSVVADTAYEINITIDSKVSTFIRGLTSSTNSEGTFVVYTAMWNDTTVGSAKYVLLANTTSSSARLHIRQQGGDGTASITISAISIKPLSGNYGRLL